MHNTNPHRKFLNYLPQCRSTNEYIKELVQGNRISEGDVIYTDHQTAGKGQYGRSWYDEPGKNLALSMLLKPAHFSPDSPFLLNKLIVSAVHQSLSDYIGNLTIKWPNDIFHQDRKLAGILVENAMRGNRWEQAIAGVGVNVNGDAYPHFDPPAISLGAVMGEEVDIHVLANDVAVNLLNWYRNKSREVVEAYYNEHLYKKGVYTRFQSGQSWLAAAVQGVDANGWLVLMSSDGTWERYRHGEVKFVFD